MMIKVTDSIRINMEDPKNFTIEKRRVVREGKNAGAEQWDGLGYHGTLKNAAQALLTRHLGLFVSDASTVRDLKRVIEVIDESAYLIAKACEESKAA